MPNWFAVSGSRLPVRLFTALISILFILAVQPSWGFLPYKGETNADSAAIFRVLSDMEQHAKNIYATIYTQDYAQASDQFSWFHDGITRLTNTVPGQKKEKKTLSKVITNMGQAIGAKNRHNALFAANQITQLVAKMREPYHPIIPTAITHLGYLGRELQIWSMANNTRKLRATATAIAATWQEVRLVVLSYDGSAMQAEQIDGLVDQITRAKTTDEYGRLAQPTLDAAGKLESAFAKAPVYMR